MDDNKKSTTIWLRPSVISRMDGWLEADNCQSRSEFVDKALRFYMGYLGTEDNTAYISKAILTAIQGTLDDKEIASIQSELDNAAKVQDEVVIAAVYPLETLLRATRNQ